jgi:hypothetical protein
MAVDVRPLTTRFGEEVRRARAEALLTYRAIIEKELVAHPDHREEILRSALAQLRETRAKAREEGNEVVEDIVLDAMDLVTDWTGRSVRV